MLREISYSKLLGKILKSFLSLFYKKKYLSGKYFEEKRIGYKWALNSLITRITHLRSSPPWPVGKNTLVGSYKNIVFDPSSLNIFQMNGCYFQAHGAKIVIGKNCEIAPNCGLITTNHDPKHISKHLPGKSIVIGDNCWVGMNSVILPGVILGDNTIVGAGSVVTKSFIEGSLIIAGNPARIIKKNEK